MKEIIVKEEDILKRLDGLEEWPNNPLQYSCLKNPHGQRSLTGYIPDTHKEPDTTVRMSRPETKIYF